MRRLRPRPVGRSSAVGRRLLPPDRALNASRVLLGFEFDSSGFFRSCRFWK